MYVRNNLGSYGGLGNYDGFGGDTTCNNPAIARLPNCGAFSAAAGSDWRASAAAMSYSDALMAAHAKDRGRYDATLSKGDGFKNQLSGSIVNWLNTARAKVVQIADQAFGRSDADAERFAQGRTAAAESFVRYKSYSEDAPDISRLLETAAKQSLTDITSGDPFRALKKQMDPDGDGVNYKMIGLAIAGVIIAIVAVYSFAGGVGRGLVS